MAKPSNEFQVAHGFFHSEGVMNMLDTQYVFESKYKSGHSMRSDDIWADSIGYAVSSVEADAFAVANPTVIKKYHQFPLSMVPGTNGQAYYINDASKFVRSWVAPVDVPHATSNEPSYGYQAILYNSSNQQLPLTSGVYVFNYYAGLVLFQKGSTPTDLGWGTPKISCYAYVGAKGVASITKGYQISIGTLSYDMTSPIAALTTPPNTRILEIIANVKTAFNGANPTLSIGSALLPNELINGLYLGSADKFTYQLTVPYTENVIATLDGMIGSTQGVVDIEINYYIF